MKLIFYGTGDRVVDTLLIYALSDLARKADPKVAFEWNLGYPAIFTLDSSYPDIEQKMLESLRRSWRSFTVANRLRFWLNIGNKSWLTNPQACLYCVGKESKKTKCDGKGSCGKVNVPAYPIFVSNLMDIKNLSWRKTQLLSKGKSKEKSDWRTLYLGLSPYWSKGRRRWNSCWDESSTYVPTQIQVLALYGLANYAITHVNENTFTEMIFSPPCSMRIGNEDAEWLRAVVKRIVNRFELTVRQLSLSELPVKVLPLVLLSQLDLPSLTVLTKGELSLLFVEYDLDREMPKNPRGYEEWNVTEISNFYLRLENHFWDFKCMIEDLTYSMKYDEFKACLKEILLDLSFAIGGRNIWRLSDALLKILNLSKVLSIHLPTPDAVLKARELLS